MRLIRGTKSSFVFDGFAVSSRSIDKRDSDGDDDDDKDDIL